MMLRVSQRLREAITAHPLHVNPQILRSRGHQWAGSSRVHPYTDEDGRFHRADRIPAMAHVPDMGRVPEQDFSPLADDEKPPLLCVHGMIGAKGNWEVLVPYITDRWTFYVDYGEAGTAPVDECVDELAEQIVELSQKIHASELILLGHSRGGLIALLAASRPEVQCVVTIHRIIGLGAHFSGIPRWKLLPKDVSSYGPALSVFFRLTHKFAYWAVGASAYDQFTDSPDLQRALHGVDRSIEVIPIASNTDYIVRPSAAFDVPTDHVAPVLLQDYFPGAKILHNLLPRDGRAIAMVKAAIAKGAIRRDSALGDSIRGAKEQ